MEFDFEEMNEIKLKKHCNYLLSQLKFRNKKEWGKLNEEFISAEHENLKELLSKIQDSLTQ